MKRLLMLSLLALALMALAQETGYQVGQVVTDFTLKNTDQQTVSLAGYPQAKGYIVIFGCNTCPVSRGYENRMVALQDKFAARGYPVIMINPNDPEAQPGESFEDMQQHAQKSKLNFPYLEDPGQVITRRFGALRTPHVFVLQKTPKGNVVAYIGAIDNDPDNGNNSKINYVQNAVTALLAGQQPEVTFTKAVGCGVKSRRS
ncbi:thioredoxin family protein [Chitinophaga agrisoli]|uniref:Thioredoxin family protein n=1 Tax=Chitinophaga agrisoli TaxID=2607653 RepID=A0A5B2VJJ5_9BACT|nr:thioredoxin family protein [Chitinophaga agrisoli]KAA2238716.1 thioredoxin family protein [Chitinophaga agrisoli]